MIVFVTDCRRLTHHRRIQPWSVSPRRTASRVNEMEAVARIKEKCVRGQGREGGGENSVHALVSQLLVSKLFVSDSSGPRAVHSRLPPATLQTLDKTDGIAKMCTACCTDYCACSDGQMDSILYVNIFGRIIQGMHFFFFVSAHIFPCQSFSFVGASPHCSSLEDSINPCPSSISREMRGHWSSD